jgi:hypothetical protein
MINREMEYQRGEERYGYDGKITLKSKGLGQTRIHELVTHIIVLSRISRNENKAYSVRWD